MMPTEYDILRKYEDVSAASDRLPPDMEPAVLGLAGEVGSVLAVAKKLVREGAAYTRYDRDLHEELGDSIWYLAAVCRRASVPLSDVLEEEHESDPALDKNKCLIDLFESSARVVRDPDSLDALRDFGNKFQVALSAFDLTLNHILTANINKVSGAFVSLDVTSLPDFDAEFPEEEQLPRCMRVHLVQRASGMTHMSINGVFVGDPLLDNVPSADGYRFHDVFHLANASVLHWSPVIRALLKRKRKSNKDIDGTQDSGRAIVVEEGLSAWLFQRAKPLNFFQGAKSVPYDILKTVQDFVSPYEVADCPPAAWERAILQGYEVFRTIREKQSGYLVCDRYERKISYEDD